MGTRKGFLGTSVLPFAIFIALCRRLRPKLILHERTKNFKWEIFCNEEDEEKSESNDEDNDVAECRRPELRPPALTGSQQSDKDMFPGYKVHHMLTKPLDYGWPVQRGRSYTAIVHPSLEMKVGLSEIYRLFISPGPTLDAGVFLADSEKEAGGCTHDT